MRYASRLQCRVLLKQQNIQYLPFLDILIILLVDCNCKRCGNIAGFLVNVWKRQHILKRTDLAAILDLSAILQLENRINKLVSQLMFTGPELRKPRRVRHFRIQNFPSSKFSEFKIFRIQNFPRSKFSEFKIFRVQNLFNFSECRQRVVTKLQ